MEFETHSCCGSAKNDEKMRFSIKKLSVLKLFLCILKPVFFFSASRLENFFSNRASVYRFLWCFMTNPRDLGSTWVCSFTWKYFRSPLMSAFLSIGPQSWRKLWKCLQIWLYGIFLKVAFFSSYHRSQIDLDAAAFFLSVYES